MVKLINITLDDSDHELLVQVKGDRTWRDLLLAHIKTKSEVENNENQN